MGSMKELIKRGILVGLGTAEATRAKVRKVVDSFVRKKAITKEDGKAIAEKIVRELEKQRSKIKGISNESLKEIAARASTLEKQLERKGRRVAKSMIKKAERELKR